MGGLEGELLEYLHQNAGVLPHHGTVETAQGSYAGGADAASPARSPQSSDFSRARVRTRASSSNTNSTGVKSVVPASAKDPMPARTVPSSPTIDTPARPSTPPTSI